MFLNYFRLDFQASYKLDVPSLCVDFREDIEFHFSLGWQAILRKFLAPHNASLAIALGANVGALTQTIFNDYSYLRRRRVGWDYYTNKERVLGRFSNDEKPKPKQFLRSIKIEAGSAMNQSQFLAITCNSLEAREKSRVRGAIGFGFGFASHWLKNWRDSFKSITKRSNRNHVIIIFDSHLKTPLLSSPQSLPFVVLRVVVVVVFLMKSCDCTEIKTNKRSKSCEGMVGEGDSL